MKKSIIAVLILVMTLFTPLIVSTNVAITHDVNLTLANVGSKNWSGYAITASPGAVTDVKGSWTVPAVQGNAKGTYSAFWIGIDGYDSSTVEQIGTSSDTDSRGRPVYYAWYEMYPDYPVTIEHTVSVGDKMTGEVSYASGMFTLILIDAGTNGVYGEATDWTETITQAATSSMQRSSAEWVAEAPSSIHRVLPLANFGTVTFTDCQATIGGTTASISGFSYGYDAIFMLANPKTVKAAPSALSTDGSAFSVTWLRK
jgi:hypothetical protein